MNGRTPYEFMEAHGIKDLAEAERLMAEEMAEKCDRAVDEKKEAGQ